jgi:hypothetical protein
LRSARQLFALLQQQLLKFILAYLAIPVEIELVKEVLNLLFCLVSQELSNFFDVYGP